MKYFLSILILLSTSVNAEVITKDIALETNSVSAEYSEISKTGMLRVIGCELCTQKIYNFNEDTEILKNGKPETLSTFMKGYWSAKYPTIYVSKSDLSIIRISY